MTLSMPRTISSTVKVRRAIHASGLVIQSISRQEKRGEYEPPGEQSYSSTPRARQQVSGVTSPGGGVRKCVFVQGRTTGGYWGGGLICLPHEGKHIRATLVRMLETIALPVL
jgi:hypothetical protein